MSTPPDSRTNTAAGGRTVLEEPAPAFSIQQAEEIAQRAFDIRAAAHPLASERDQNYHLRAEDGSEWVLKIANSAESPAILDMQTQALLHIAQADPSLGVPRVRTTADGAPFHELDGDDGRRFSVRVLSFLPGQLLDDAAPHPALARDVGAMTARLARALRGFSHPSSRHELLWDLTQAPGLRARTRHIENPGRRRVIEEVLDHFASDVLSRLRKQRAQVIHNDVSCMNTLVDGDRISGVIDFGDLIHAPLICDLAVPISELLVGHSDPIATAAEITAGYHAVTALEDEELRLIFDLAATRCAMSVAVANWRARDHPENTAYIKAGVEETGALLDQMREWGAARMYAGLRRACATPVSISVPVALSTASGRDDLESLVLRRGRAKLDEADQVEEEIWALEEQCACRMRDGDLEGFIAFFHDQFLGWIGSDHPCADREGLRQFTIKNIEEGGTYSFDIERVDLRVIENIATTCLLFHCFGTNSEGIGYEETYRWAHTWIRDDGSWKVLLGTNHRMDG